MRPKHGLLVGPGAAGLLGWDGFSPTDPTLWLVPHASGTSGRGIIRSRLWRPSGALTADPYLVLAHCSKASDRFTEDRVTTYRLRLSTVSNWLTRAICAMGAPHRPAMGEGAHRR